jgi:hypothetical protein
MQRRLAGLLALAVAACASTGADDNLDASEPAPKAGATTTVPDAAQAAIPTGPSPAGRSIGTAHPLVIQAISPTGNWISYCQARKDTDGDGAIQVRVGYHGDTYGDALAPFVDLDGRELEIDAFVSATRGGRWVAVTRGGDLELHDATAGTALTLDADARDDPNPRGGHRAASFDASGKRILYIGNRKQGATLVLRTLASGKETRIAAKGEIWRAWIDEGGKYVWAWVVTKDTDGDGNLGMPLNNTTLSDRQCRGPVAVSGSYGWSGDEPELMLAPIASGAKLAPSPGAIGVLGDVIVARRDDGTLEARGKDGTKTIAKADCKANVLFADASTGHLAFVCRSREQVDASHTVWAPLYFWDAGKLTDTGEEMTPTSEDNFDTRLRVWRARGEKPYDLATGEFVTSRAGPKDTAIGGTEARTLHVPRKGKPYVYDAKTSERTPLSVRLRVDHDDYMHPVQVAGNMLVAPVDEKRDVVIDLATASVRGFVPGHALAITTGGDVLIGNTAASGLLEGPLQWHAPAPD